MRLKVYRAAGIAEAMTRIRAEMGPDALILTTRRTEGGIEVTAALETEEAISPPLPRNDPDLEAALRFHGVPQALRARLQDGLLASGLQATLPFAALKLDRDAAPLLFAGPPGAGKTLTVARLATRMVLGGRRPMVLTADGKRAGAAEQLAAFTRLLGISLIVASHPLTLARALTGRPEGAPVLIDAPGIDPFDPAQRGDLAALAETARATIVLVLPAGLDVEESADLAAAFAEAGANGLIATRMDLARRIGNVLAAAASGLALAEAGVGPGAADGLTALTPDFLAGRLLAPTRTRTLEHTA